MPSARSAAASLVISALMGSSATANPVNVALGRPVVLSAGATNGAPLSSLTDGAFLTRGTQWQTGTVWWTGTATSLEINLGSSYSLIGAIAQGDDNDSYSLEYWNASSSTWSALWTVPFSSGGGMQTRPNPSDSTEIFSFPAPVVTDRIRFMALSGDGNYGVSEIQVYAVPSPGGAFIAGTSVLWMLRRRRA